MAPVLRAVEFARSEQLQVAVRSGAHSIPGFSTCDDGLVIDLSALKGVNVDPDAKTARAQPGLKWAEFDHETQAFGLAVTGGLVSSTGLAGFTLGGGLGWLVRKHGMACDNLLSADLVTADGRLVHASAEENSELFWGLRGGGGNFGVVTSLEYQLHDVGPTVIGGPVFYPGENAAEILRFYRDWAPQLPDELTTFISLLTAPPAPFIPEEWHGKPLIGVISCYAGPLEQGLRAVEPLRSLADPVADLLGPIPYVALQGLVDALYPKGTRAYMKAGYVRELDDHAIETLTRYHQGATSPRSEIHLHHFGGAVARVPEDQSAYGERHAPYILNMLAMDSETEGFQRHIDWAQQLYAEIEPSLTGGSYINFLSAEGEQRVQAAYGPEKFARLQALKDEYDPTNLFQLNQNIPPSK
ncbi:MAG: FAD-dependent oxidoreductase [Solirubrobacterales bacterium]|nr:FAD-dependent oxidoreductase [Solirubrobacterales bacterium]